MLSGSGLGATAITTLAAAGFSTIAATRIRLMVESRRTGNRLEMIRSAILACIMSICAAAAFYGTLIRVVSSLTSTTR